MVALIFIIKFCNQYYCQLGRGSNHKGTIKLVHPTQAYIYIYMLMNREAQYYKWGLRDARILSAYSWWFKLSSMMIGCIN